MAEELSPATRGAIADTAWMNRPAAVATPTQTPEQVAAAAQVASTAAAQAATLQSTVASQNASLLSSIAAGNTDAYYRVMATAVQNPYDSRSTYGAEIASRIYQNPSVTVPTAETGKIQSGTFGSLGNPYGYASTGYRTYEETLAAQIAAAKAAVTPEQAALAELAQNAFLSGSAYNQRSTITTNPGTFRGGAETYADIAAQVAATGGTVDSSFAGKAAGVVAPPVLSATPSPLTVIPTPTIQYASPLVTTEMKEIGNTGIYSIVGTPSQVINQNAPQTPSNSLSSMAIGNTGVYSLVGYQSQILGSNPIAPSQQSSLGVEISPGVYTTGKISKIATLPEYKSTEIAPGVYTTGVLSALNKTPGVGLQEFTIAQNNPIVSGLIAAPLLAFGITAGKTISETESNVLTGIDALPLPSVLKEYGKLVTGFGTGATSMLVTTGPLAVAGTELALLHPSSFIENIIPSVVSTGESTLKHASEQPSAFFGELLGMYAGGKIATTAASYSPVRVGIAEVPTGQTIFPAATTSFVDRILSGSPLVREAAAPYVSEFGSANKYAYLSAGFGEVKTPQITFAYGSEISPQVVLGKSSLTDLIRTTNIEIPTEFAKYAPYEWTSAQREIITPFIEQTAATPYESMLVTTARDLGRSEANLKYNPYQPIGTAVQADVNFITSQKIQSVLGAAEEKSIVVGSRSQVDLWGEQFFRDVTKSDVDISASIMEQGSMFKGLKEAYASTEIEPRRSTIWDVTLERGLKIPENVNFDVSAPEKRGFSFGVPGKEHALGVHPLEYNVDVRGMPVINVAGTKTFIQTPENAILTKLSRVAGAGSKAESPAAFRYSPESGVTTVDLTGGKQINDLADIYAINRGIAKTAYSQGFYDLGKTFESRSNAIAGRIQSEGSDINSIVLRDILENTPRAPQRIGAVLGVGIDLGKMPVSEEYPSTPMRAQNTAQESSYALSFAPLKTGAVLSEGVGYPYLTGSAKQSSNSLKEISIYPESVKTQSKSDYSYLSDYTYPSEIKTTPIPYPVTIPTPNTNNNYPPISSDLGNNGRIQIVADRNLMSFGERINKISETEYKKHDEENKLLKKKRKQQPYIMFRELLPTVTPIEEMGGFKSGKPFFRAIGNQQILEVTPERRDWLHSVDVDVNMEELVEQEARNKVSDMTGTFYRTATKQEKVKTGRPILSYQPSRQELATAKLVGFGTGAKSKKSRKAPWF